MNPCNSTTWMKPLMHWSTMCVRLASLTVTASSALLTTYDHRGVVTLKKGLVTLEAPVSLLVYPICSLDDDETMILRTCLYTLI